MKDDPRTVIENIRRHILEHEPEKAIEGAQMLLEIMSEKKIHCSSNAVEEIFNALYYLREADRDHSLRDDVRQKHIDCALRSLGVIWDALAQWSEKA